MNNNPEIELAWQCIEQTGSHLFLTGKAGTGKTTFLRKLKENSPKRMIVVAPTGIAAINAKGVTIHSFFQLSFAPYLPETTLNSGKHQYKFGKEKINIIRGLDLLVIDEISMVRADLLDAVDAVLRRYRDRHKPFGGVQLLMIGDLQQLAPVVKDDEWGLLSRHYKTPYFFDSHALKETDYITIQLNKVYRQDDEKFLYLLNRIRINNIDDQLLYELNKRFIPRFHPNDDEGYVRLTTHNFQAKRINEQRLRELPGSLFSFTSEVKGTFPEYAYPTDAELHLKCGAQIMFIKNDSSGAGRYYNGKIGVVTAVSNDSIIVRGNGDTHEFALDKEVWENNKYTLNPANNEITEEIEGTFSQFPIRLAWAITIHKSQGLTFERAIIDATLSFAHGQVYVALSRCRTLEGLVLSSPLTRESIIADDTVNDFTRSAEERVPDAQQLELLKRNYFFEIASEQFGFAEIRKQLLLLRRLLDEFLHQLYPRTLEAYNASYVRFENEIEKVAITFQKQYAELISLPGYAQNTLLQKRFISAARYFREKCDEILLSLIKQTRIQTDNKEVQKRFDIGFTTLREELQVKLGTFTVVAEKGFSVQSYLKSKAQIIIAFSKKGPAKEKAAKGSGKVSKKEKEKEKIEPSSDMRNPEIYKALIRWRNEEAGRQGVPVYVVLRQKALLTIADTVPVTLHDLTAIPFLGEKGIAKYGTDILEIVDSFRR